MIYRNAPGTNLFLGVGLATVMVIASSTPAEAQAPGPFERGAQLVSGVAGWQSFGLEDESESGEQELSEAMTYGGSYQYFVTPRVSFEAAFQFGPTSADVEGAGDDDVEENGDDDDNGDDGEDDDGANVNVVYVTGAINYNLRRGGRFIPFVTAGGGAVSLDVSGAGTDSTLAGMVGAGLLFAWTDRLLLRADVRDYIYSANSLSAASLQALMLPDGFNGTVYDLSVTGGVSWRF